MNRRLVLLNAVLSVTAYAAVDPALLALVTPEARVLIGVQVTQGAAAPFGQYILARTQLDDAKLQAVMASIGLDPIHDLQEILAVASTDTKAAIVLGRGTFQPTKIAAAAAASGGVTIQYRGFTVILLAPAGQGAVAFLDSSIAAMGNQTAVQAAIDRRLSGAVFAGPLAQKAQLISADNQVWFATVTPLSDFLSAKTADPNVGALFQSNLLQSVQQASGGLSFGAINVTMAVEAVTGSDGDAQSLSNVLNFLVGFLRNGRDASLSQVANTVQFATVGSNVKVTLSITEQQAEQLFPPSQVPAQALRRNARP